MIQMQVKVELEQRYCPSCRFDTQHAVRVVGRVGYSRPEEVNSACGVCNGDAFWALRMSQEETVKAAIAGPVKVLPGVT